MKEIVSNRRLYNIVSLSIVYAVNDRLTRTKWGEDVSSYEKSVLTKGDKVVSVSKELKLTPNFFLPSFSIILY